MTTRLGTHAASFRDPSGFIFNENGRLYRQVNAVYRTTYQRFMSSGLYERLIDKQLLIPHQEVERRGDDQIIEPEFINFIAYPYEWSFSQLQDAALTTLDVLELALSHGFILKDASAYNVQFHRGRPLFIDTLSFEPYIAGKPWVAYRQFCQHFLAPLALMAKVDVRLSRLLSSYLDGLPLELASHLLPNHSRLNLGLLTHLHIHAAAQQRYATATQKRKIDGVFSQTALLGLIGNLRSTVKKLLLPTQSTEWDHYYEKTNYSAIAFAHKKQIICDFVSATHPTAVCDIGANTGLFSQFTSAPEVWMLAVDYDPLAVEQGYKEIRQLNNTHVLPLLIDITNPSPAIGWANTERQSFIERLHVDMLMALALVHHLAISNNLPLTHIARHFAQLAPQLIIEFVPKEDSQVQKLLANRANIFPNYHQAGFERAFGEFYSIIRRVPIKESQRLIYLMRRKAKLSDRQS